MNSNRDEIFGKLPKGTTMWCMHCERTYSYGENRIASVEMGKDLMQMCPYKDCDGDAALDAKEWDWVREQHPDYPEQPERGKVYPLY